jgi:hypothetical protein
MKTCVVRKRIPPYSGTTGISIADTIYTPPGFGTPKFALFFYTNGSDNDTYDESSTNRVVGVGYVGLSAVDNASFSQFTSFLGYLHNQANNSAVNKSVSGNSNSRFAYEIKLDRSVVRQFVFTSFDVDKMNYNLTHTNTSTNNLDLVCIFFTGSDVQANIGYLPLGLSNGLTASVTGLTFQPDLIFASGAGFGTNNNNYDGRLSFGCSTRFGSIKNSSSAFRMRNSLNVSVGTTVSEYFSDNRCFSIFSTNSTTAIATADVTSFNNDGFTVTSRGTFSSGITNHMIYMAIKGPSSNIFDLQNYTSSTSTGISGIATTNFIPSLVIGALGTVTSINTETTSNNSTGYSLFAAKSLTAKSNYGLGTMSVTSGLTAVTGSGTAFSSLNPGDVIYNSTNNQIGTVSSFSTNTSLTLSSGASATMSSENYSVTPFGQFSVSIGSSNNATTTQVYSAINTNPFFVASYGTAASPSTLIKGKVNNFDSYPGFKINYETANATARKGWFVAFKDNENRRRDSN